MKEDKYKLKEKNSEILLHEEADIDYNVKRPGLFKYYFLASFRWIASYWYLTFPVIIVAIFLLATSGIQYFQGNDKPVWGTRIEKLSNENEITKAAQKITDSKTQSNTYNFYKIRVSGPEIHIEIGLKTKSVEDEQKAQELIKSAYKLLISQLPSPIKAKVKQQYSIQGVVAGKVPDKSKTNVFATKAKNNDNWNFYTGK